MWHIIDPLGAQSTSRTTAEASYEPQPSCSTDRSVCGSSVCARVTSIGV
jgi:hypothetical protein